MSSVGRMVIEMKLCAGISPASIPGEWCLCHSVPPVPSAGTPKLPSDALPPQSERGVGKRRSAAPQGLRFLFCSRY